VDTTLSLLGFAVTINSAILILASAAFYYGGDAAIRAAGANADLFGAHQLITQQISKGKRPNPRQIPILGNSPPQRYLQLRLLFLRWPYFV